MEESEFESDEKKPNIDKAELYIFIAKVDKLPPFLLDKSFFARQLVGIIRVFIHETIHGIRMLKRLLDNQGVPTWSKNQYKDWCVPKSQFDKFVDTPSRLGPSSLRLAQRWCRRVDSVVDRTGKWRRPPAGFAAQARARSPSETRAAAQTPVHGADVNLP